jgi:hypothetical protein
LFGLSCRPFHVSAPACRVRHTCRNCGPAPHRSPNGGPGGAAGCNHV